MAKNRLLPLFLIVVLFLFVAPTVHAALISDSFSSVLGGVSDFFDNSLSGVGHNGLVKFMYWVLVFTITYFVGLKSFSALGKNGGAENAPKKMAMIISIVLATSAIVFTPQDIMEMVFRLYSGILALVLFAIIIGGVVFYVYTKEFMAQAPPPALHFVRFLALVLSAALLTAVIQVLPRFAG